MENPNFEAKLDQLLGIEETSVTIFPSDFDARVLYILDNISREDRLIMASELVAKNEHPLGNSIRERELSFV